MLLLAALLLAAPYVRATYYPLAFYEGNTFFDGFDFYGAIDNTTWGNVTYVTAADATAESLAFVNNAGNAILRVDNTTEVFNTGTVEYRKSVRLTSKINFGVGSLIVIDAVHMPYGCSVWPSIWMNGLLQEGQTWPDAGEIDIIEAINLMNHNQMALHSTAGCLQPANVTQLGQSIMHNCNDTSASGCNVAETKPNSYGPGFNNAGGGVFALQFDVSGIFMWFWSRTNVPKTISSSVGDPTVQMVLTDWGTPSAAYPAGPLGCNITQFFPPQQLIVDITLCGLWAGIQGIYDAQCPGTCFATQIAGNGSNYADAYFEIGSIRAWTVNPAIAAAESSSLSVASASASAAQASVASAAAAAEQTTTTTSTGAALGLRVSASGLLAVVLGLAGLLLVG